MKCKYEHDGDCCNAGADQYMCKCKKPCEFIWPLSNADHIRSMSDEELADYMSEHSIEDFCYIVCGGNCKAMATFNKTSYQVCREIVADWLKQPYSGGDA